MGHIFISKDVINAVDERPPAGLAKADEQNPVMRSWREPSRVRKIHILRNHESRFALSRLPNEGVGLTAQAFFSDGLDIVA